MNRLFKFWSLTWREKQLLAEAGILLALSTLCVKILPFKSIYNLLRDCYGSLETCAGEAAYDYASEIKLIEVSISRATNGLPWRSLCLSQSIAAFIMLRRRGILASLLAGVRILEDSSLAAHAWVSTGDKANEKNLKASEFAVVVRIGQGRSA